MRYFGSVAVVLLGYFLVGCATTKNAPKVERAVASDTVPFKTEDFGKVAIHAITYSRQSQQLAALVSDANKLGFMVLCQTPKFDSESQLKLGMVLDCKIERRNSFIATEQTIEKINLYFPSALEQANKIRQDRENSRRLREYEPPSVMTPALFGSLLTFGGAIYAQESLSQFRGASLKGKAIKSIKGAGSVAAVGLGVVLLGVYVHNEFFAGFENLPIQPLETNIKAHLSELLSGRSLSADQKEQLGQALSNSQQLEPIFFEVFKDAIVIAIRDATTA